MEKVVHNIAQGVLIAALSAGGIGMFTMYTEVQLLKAHSHSTDAALRANHEAGKEFMNTLANINATLAAQTEAINNLKEAMRMKEPMSYVSYMPQREDLYDR